MGFSEKAGKFQIALLVNDMCKGKKFSDITVSDICGVAGISRATFYRLFPDKFSLNNWCQAFNFSVGILQIGRRYTWEDGLFMAYSCAHFFSGVARASYDGQDGKESSSFGHRCMSACLADTLENVKGVPCKGRLAFQVDYYSGALVRASTDYWASSKPSADLRAFVVELAHCVPVDLFEALNEPVDPQPAFDVNAATLARAAQEMDEEFFLRV